MRFSRHPIVTGVGAAAALSLALASLASLSSACGGTSPPARTASAVAAPRAQNAIEPTNAARAPESGVVQISKEIRKACGISDADAFFAFDSVRLQKHDIPVLDKVASCFTSGPLRGHSVKLVGRADATGPAAYNMELGLRRADSVAGYLTHQGMRPTQTEATSRGASDAQGTDDRTRAQDRRVDLLLGS